jgi:hypothetical protein
VLYQLISTSAISVFLFNANSSWVIFGFVLNVIALATVLRTQRLAEKRDAANQKISSALSWLVALITPFILFGVSLNFLLTPSFIRIEYTMPHMPADLYGFSKSERFQWASETIDYLTNVKQTRYLSRLTFENETPVFKDHEIAILGSIKNSAQNILTIGRLALAFFFILILLAWAGNWLPKFRHGVKRGGWLTIGLAILLGIVVTVSRINLNNYFQNTDTILRLFPLRFWQDAFLFMAISLIGSGLLLAISLPKAESNSQE